VQHQTGVQKDSMTLYHLQNGHSVLMYDHLFMEQLLLELQMIMIVLKTFYGQLFQVQHYLETQQQTDVV